MDQKAVLWGFPCGKTLSGEWLAELCAFYDRTKHISSMPQPLTHPGRVDLARSTLISRLKENKVYGWLHSWDTDVTPHDVTIKGSDLPPAINLDQIVGWTEECLALGFDMVVGTTLGPGGIPMVWTDVYTWSTVTRDNPFEIQAAAGGFYAMSRRCAEGLKVLGTLRTHAGEDMPFYCFNDGKGGEDISLFENIRESGFKACCDPRIIVSHQKPNKSVMNPAWYGEQRNAAIQQLRNRSKRLEDEESQDYKVATDGPDGPEVLPVRDAIRRE